MAALALLTFTAACSTENTEESSVEPSTEPPVVLTAPVTVHVNDFVTTQSTFDEAPSTTRSVQDATAYTDVKAIDLAFYAGNQEELKVTQVRDDGTYTTFGDFTCNLPIGTYTMVVIGRGYFAGDEFTLTSPTSAEYTSERPRETFSHTQTVTVSSTTPLDLSVTVERIMSMLIIQSTDVVPSGVAKFRTTYAAGSKAFNPTTGLATSNTGFVVTNSPYTSNDGKLSIGSNLFLATDEQNIDVTVEVLNSNNDVLFTKALQNVPFRRNRKTTISGALFTAASSNAAISFETSWLDGVTVNF